jgi:hypothetical protein
MFRPMPIDRSVSLVRYCAADDGEVLSASYNSVRICKRTKEPIARLCNHRYTVKRPGPIGNYKIFLVLTIGTIGNVIAMS